MVMRELEGWSQFLILLCLLSIKCSMYCAYIPREIVEEGLWYYSRADEPIIILFPPQQLLTSLILCRYRSETFGMMKALHFPYGEIRVFEINEFKAHGESWVGNEE